MLRAGLHLPRRRCLAASSRGDVNRRGCGGAGSTVVPPGTPAARAATALDAVRHSGVLHLPAARARRCCRRSSCLLRKAATTFLYECLLANFGPTQVGCGSSADGWDAKGGRGRATALARTCGRIGREEAFFFGGKAEDKADRGGRDDRRLREPSAAQAGVAAGAVGVGQPERARDALDRFRTLCEDSPALPLTCTAAAGANHSVAGGDAEPVEAEGGAPAAAVDCARPRCSVLGVAACEGDNFRYNRVSCSGQGTTRKQPVGKCTHPACIRIVESKGAWSGQYSTRCQWEKGLKSKVRGRSDSYCLHSMGLGAPGELNLSVVDFTPNYMCDATSIARLKRTAGKQADQLRFIVVMRDPIYRAFSEWSMFSLGWNWDPIKNFSGSIATQVQKLRKCDSELFMQPRKLRALPTAQARCVH